MVEMDRDSILLDIRGAIVCLEAVEAFTRTSMDELARMELKTILQCLTRIARFNDAAVEAGRWPRNDAT